MKKNLAVILAFTMLFCGVISVCTVSAEAPYTDTTGWKIEPSSQLGSSGVGAFDGNTASYWHSNYTVEDGKITGHDGCPFTVVVTFPSALEISAVRYIPRQKTDKDGSSAGIWKKAEIYASTNGTDFTKLADATYDVMASRATTDTPIAKAKYKAMKIIITESDAGYCTAAEIQFINPNGVAGAPVTPVTPVAPATPATPASPTASVAAATKTVGEKLKSNDKWVITASSDFGGSAPAMLDGNTDSYWHSSYKAQGSTIVSHDVAPFTVDLSFGAKTVVSGIGYIPRQNNTGGYWKKITVSTSMDGKQYTPVCSDTYTYAGTDNGLKISGFGKNVTCKFLRVFISESANYAMASELNIYGEIKSTAPVKVITTTTADATPGSGKVVLTIGSTNASSNGSSSTLPVAPVIAGGATMIPAKFVTEALGGTYTENGNDVTITYNGLSYNLKKNTTYLACNGVRMLLTKPTYDINETTMVSALLFRDTLRVKMELNQAQQAIILKK